MSRIRNKITEYVCSLVYAASCFGSEICLIISIWTIYFALKVFS